MATNLLNRKRICIYLSNLLPPLGLGLGLGWRRLIHSMDGTRRDGVVITGWRKRFCTRECLAWNKLPKAVVVALRTV